MTEILSHAMHDYSLPEGSLNFLRQCIVRHRIERVFEFGSGRSTRLMLECGCETTSLENDPRWLAETESGLSADARVRWRPITQSLVPLFLNGAPMKGWMLTDDALQSLREAQLVLIDSPAFPPFREHALVTALANVRQGLIVVDDANIPTVRRLCERLARANNLSARYLPEDHGFFVISLVPPTHEASAPSEVIQRSVRVSRGLWETVKAWRRYAIA